MEQTEKRHYGKEDPSACHSVRWVTIRKECTGSFNCFGKVFSPEQSVAYMGVFMLNFVSVHLF